MAKKIKISYLVFSDSETSFGLELLFATLREHYEIEAIKFDTERPDVTGCDFVFVSLIWWEDVLAFMKIADRFGIKPGISAKIIIGGASFNPHLLNGKYDVGVLGDGETVICELVDKLSQGISVDDVLGCVTKNNIGTSKTYRTNPIVPAYIHTEIRRSSIPRIEIARGCKHKCPFCQVAHMKPYRELPTEMVLSLCKQVKGKSVGLFAPDRCDHSGFEEIQKSLRKWGKRDSSRDARFDSLSKFDMVDGGLTLGLEGLTEQGRLLNRKAGKREDVLSYFDMIFNKITNRKGEPLTTCQVYMILDLPTERDVDPFVEFQSLLQEINDMCRRHFTLFLVANTFSSKAFTKFSHDGLSLWADYGEKWNGMKAFGTEMKIAKRGGFLAPVRRIVQALCDRGDEKLFPLVFTMATKGFKHLNSHDKNAVASLDKEIKKAGWQPNDIYGKTEKQLWFDNYSIEKIER
jgi:hypothetical protein